MVCRGKFLIPLQENNGPSLTVYTISDRHMAIWRSLRVKYKLNTMKQSSDDHRLCLDDLKRY